MAPKTTIKNSVFNYEKTDFPKLSETQLSNLNKIELIFGDITQVHCDCIVNSASPNLLGGKGVDGAIHAAAGPELRQECETLGGCQTGEAKITKAYNLPCEYIIHTVGPVYSRNEKEENKKLLTSCYYNSLKLANDNNIKTITFPAISTGMFGFPTRYALPIVFSVITEGLNEFGNIERVNLICHSPINFAAYNSFREELIKANTKKSTKKTTKK